jgi:hypothetical protein
MFLIQWMGKLKNKQDFNAQNEKFLSKKQKQNFSFEPSLWIWQSSETVIDISIPESIHMMYFINAHHTLDLVISIDLQLAMRFGV